MSLSIPQASSVGLFSLALVALTPAPVAAQGTITNGNVSYTVGAIGSGQSEAVDCNFTANAPVTTDVLTEQWWWYRIDNDADERVLRDDGTLTQSYAGRHADLNWSDVESRGLVRAHLGLDVVSTGPTNGFVFSRLTVSNITTRPVVMNVFHYVDIDVCANVNNFASGTGDVQMVRGPCPTQSVRIEGTIADRWFVEGRDDSECDIADSGLATLQNSGLPFNRGNYTGAVQWQDVVIPVGWFVTFGTRLEHNPGPCGNATSVNYGQGLPGIRGVPTISTPVLPRLGTSASLQVGNALPSVTGILLFGFGRTNQPLLNITILVQPGPRGTQFDFFNIPTDATGGFTLPVPIPAGRELCGAQIQWQYFFPDFSVVGGLPLAHTDAVEWTVGN